MQIIYIDESAKIAEQLRVLFCFDEISIISNRRVCTLNKHASLCTINLKLGILIKRIISKIFVASFVASLAVYRLLIICSVIYQEDFLLNDQTNLPVSDVRS